MPGKLLKQTSTMLHKYELGHNENGTRTVAWFDDDTCEMITRDIQSADVNQKIIDNNKMWRDTERSDRHNQPPDQGIKVASIPITIWHNWKRDWERNFKDKWTWQTYELIKLNDPENAAFRATNKSIPTRGPRDQSIMV